MAIPKLNAQFSRPELRPFGLLIISIHFNFEILNDCIVLAANGHLHFELQPLIAADYFAFGTQLTCNNQ